jgi:hypothetical protein
MDADAPYVAVWDLETQQKIDDMTGKFREDRIRKLSISCGSVLCIPSELCMDPVNSERALELSTMRTFWCDEDGQNSLAAMFDLVAGAELNCGYNLFGFDFLVAEKFFSSRELHRQARTRCHDVFSRVRDATSVWHKLDTLLKLNEQAQKTGDGLLAIKMWADGKRTDLQAYCEQDTTQLARLALQRELKIGGGLSLQNDNFGIATALAARRYAQNLTYNPVPAN